MSELQLLIALLVFYLLPFLLVWAPVLWYGKRHRWGVKPYALMMVVVAFGWSAVFLLFIMKAPPTAVAKVFAFLTLPAIIYAIGMIAGFRALHDRRDDSKR